MLIWLKNIDISVLGEKLFKSFYTLVPYVALGLASYFIFSFIARKLPLYRKNLFNSVAKSLGVSFIVVGFFKSLVHWGISLDFVNKIQQAIFTFVPFYVCAVVVKFILTKISLKFTKNKKTLIILICRAVTILIIIMGLVSSLNLLGFDLRVLIGSLGVSGLAIGLAVKGSVSNVVAGILIVLYEPFAVGDKIIASGKEGVVEAIELKYVTIRQDTNIVHLIPNEKILGDSVTILQKA